MQSLGRSRPLGVTIIAIVLAVTAILSIIAIILALIGVASLGGPPGTALTIALIIGLILSIIDLVVAWGLWTLQPWAFWVTAIIEGLSILQGLYRVIVQHASFFSVLLSLAVPIIILIYLFADRNVRAAFRT